MTTVISPTAETEHARLYQGDALHLLRALPEGSVDAVITDPPYSSGGMFRGDRNADPTIKYVQTATILERPTFPGDNRDQRSFRYWCAMWLADACRATKPGGVAAVFADWRQLPTMTDAIQMGGWVWRGILVWDKTGAARPMSGGGFSNQCEFIVWGTKGAKADGFPYLPGVVKQRVRRDDKFHITGKPLALMREVVRITPAAGGVVLDPFLGSGTTGVAAVELGHRFVGFEIDPPWLEVSRERIAKAAPTLTARPNPDDAGDQGQFPQLEDADEAPTDEEIEVPR